MPQGAYTMIAVDGKTIGGYMATPEGGPAGSHWLPHLQVANAQETAAKITSLGGKIRKAPFKVGDFGTMAVVADKRDATFALWQPTKAEPAGKPAIGHFVWNELTSADPAASVAFYQAIAGLETDAMDMGPMGTYHLLKSHGENVAGVMKPMMAGAPEAWLPYVSVENADATAEKAKRLGATVVVPPTDIPNVGRFAIFVDPNGAALGILKSAS